MTTPTRLLVLDEPGDAADTLCHLFAAAGYDTVVATALGTALEQLAPGAVDVVLASLELAGLQGIAQLGGSLGEAQLVVLTGDPDGAEARDTLRLGAFDVVRRAPGADGVLHAVERAAAVGSLWREVATLRARVGERVATTLVGRSTAMEQVRELVGRAAASRTTLLVTGEAGTGKDLVARLVHDLSDRAGRPYVSVRCHDADPATLEEELFGVAASGGAPARSGLFEQARGGTLVLDGVDQLPRALRLRVAEVLTERAVSRATPTGRERVPVDVRLVLATRDVPGASSPGPRDDDAWRGITFLPIALPPLRERRRDIPLLVEHFRAQHAPMAADGQRAAGPDMLSLIAREWPGNVRELEHYVERRAYLPASDEQEAAPSAGLAQLSGDGLTLEAVERRYILLVLDEVAGNQSRAADRLGIDRRTLYRKLRQYRASAPPAARMR